MSSSLLQNRNSLGYPALAVNVTLAEVSAKTSHSPMRDEANLLFSNKLQTRQPLATRLLSAAFTRRHLAGAYLLTGRAPLDKLVFTKEIASALNCEKQSTTGAICLVRFGDDTAKWCTNCRWIKDDEHPQAWRILGPDNSAKSGKVPVEQARELAEGLTRTSQYHRIIVVEDAREEYFHRPAANALLKTIEEPRSNVTFFLFVLSASEVLRTIVSRCQMIEFTSEPESHLKSIQKADVYEPESAEETVSKALRPLAEVMVKKKNSAVALELADAILGLTSDHIPFNTVIDCIAADELRGRRTSIAGDTATAHYGQEFLQLCELVKQQNKDYVSQKAVVETFVFHWSDLVDQLGKEAHLARSVP